MVKKAKDIEIMRKIIKTRWFDLIVEVEKVSDKDLFFYINFCLKLKYIEIAAQIWKLWLVFKIYF